MLTFRNVNIIALTLLTAILIYDLYFEVGVLTYFLLFLIWTLITTLGSFNIAWNYHLKALNRNANCRQKHVAITFDDGPNSDITPKILKLLKTYNAKATFFCIGKHIEQHPDIVEAIKKDGHTLGNHTYCHSPYFDFYRKKRVIEEIEQTNELVKSIIGRTMNLFRPPYGVTNPAISKAIKETKHCVVGWNIRSLDTVKKNEQKILDRITKNIAPGAIILLHDSKRISVSVLEQLLLFLQEEGYRSVTVDTLFNIEAYV